MTGSASFIHPETALLDRKIALSEQLSCRELLVQLATVETCLGDLVRGDLEAEVQVQAAKGALAEAIRNAEFASLSADTIDGKTEAARKIQRDVLVERDPGVQAAREALRQAEHQRARFAVDLDLMKRSSRGIERAIDYRVAALRFLAT